MNAIQCNHCKDIIESKNRHDFKWCKCGKVAVDGGNEYKKRIGNIYEWINWDNISDKDKQKYLKSKDK